MSTIDLQSLSLEELRQLQKDIGKAVTSFETRKKREALAAAQRAAQEMGFDLSDLTEVAKGKSLGVPKYQHPENPALTWTGRGRKPTWFVEAIDGGKSAYDMLIG